MYVPEKGDIILLNFDPSSGREIMKTRPALVLSPKIFNGHVGFCFVAPITSTIKKTRLEVILPIQLETQGSVLVHQVKSLDFVDRNIQFIEKAPLQTTDKALKIIKIILS